MPFGVSRCTQGAGGNGNVLKEIVDPAGATYDIRKVKLVEIRRRLCPDPLWVFRMYTCVSVTVRCWTPCCTYRCFFFAALK